MAVLKCTITQCDELMLIFVPSYSTLSRKCYDLVICPDEQFSLESNLTLLFISCMQGLCYMRQMQAESTEHEDITKLFRDAFVRVCKLAIADCGLSSAELTLHLSISLNAAVPQILSTTVAETVRSPLAQDSSAANGSEASNKAPSFDDDNVDTHGDEKESFASEHSFDSSIHVTDDDTEDFNRTIAVESLAPSCTNTSTFTTVKDSQLASSPLDVNDVDSFILSEDNHVEVPLEELLAGVGKSSECNTYVSGSHVALSNSREKTREADKESRHPSLSTFSSSADSLVAVNGACILAKLESYNSDAISRCTNTNCPNYSLHDSDGRDDTFLRHCHFAEQDSMCSNSACVDVESGSDGAEMEVDGLSISQHSKAADKSAAEISTSFEEELVVDELCTCSETHCCHVVSAECLSNNLSPPVNRQPMCTEAAAFDASLLQSYPTNCLLSSLCRDASDTSYSQQPNVLSVSTNSYRLVEASVNNPACDTGETEFQNILSSVSTNAAAVADADRGRCLYAIIYLLK